MRCNRGQLFRIRIQQRLGHLDPASHHLRLEHERVGDGLAGEVVVVDHVDIGNVRLLREGLGALRPWVQLERYDYLYSAAELNLWALVRSAHGFSSAAE